MNDRPETKDDNNNDISPPPSPPPQPPSSFPQHLLSGPPQPPPFVSPLSGRFLEPFQPPPPTPWPGNFISITSAPSLAPEHFYLPGPLLGTPCYNLYGSQTQVLTRIRVAEDAAQKYLKNKIYELPDDSPKLKLGFGLANLLEVEADDILDEKFKNKKELEDEALENIKEEYRFEKTVAIPNQLDFFYCGINENFVQACYFLSPSNDNKEFIAFISCDVGQHIMTNNSLWIHVESGNIFYKNFNANENFYRFPLAQRNDKIIISKCISYHYSFEKYT